MTSELPMIRMTITIRRSAVFRRKPADRRIVLDSHQNNTDRKRLSRPKSSPVGKNTLRCEPSSKRKTKTSFTKIAPKSFTTRITTFAFRRQYSLRDFWGKNVFLFPMSFYFRNVAVRHHAHADLQNDSTISCCSLTFSLRFLPHDRTI